MNKAYQLARDEIGTWEWKGKEHNPRVLQYYADVGEGWVKDDETPWCGAFTGAMLKRAGMAVPDKPLMARAYLGIGKSIDLGDAQPGDLVIFSRGNSSWQGHVGFFVRRVGTHIEVLSGNQGDQVNVKRYPVSRLLGVRRVKEGRSSMAQSTTLQATAATAASGAGGVAVALGRLDPTAQLVLVGLAAVALLALGWIARERIRKWAEGDR